MYYSYNLWNIVMIYIWSGIAETVLGGISLASNGIYCGKQKYKNVFSVVPYTVFIN